ncbi:MAG: MFS transporter [Salinivirgaceae bacterium]|jgi:FHS family L-fucose permease-like MFS transporter|nr:MFS transporter [Salinivirgaceae bacterium]
MSQTKNYGMVLLVFVTFFVISFLSNVMGPLIPLIKDSFSVGFAMAALLPFFFFAAYGVMSIPAGILVDKYKEKKMMLFSFALATLGALMFAAFPNYNNALASLFIMGTGMATLQVAINPLLRVSGGEEHFAFYSVLAQLFFGTASFISPWVSSDLVNSLDNYNEKTASFLLTQLHSLVPSSLPWTSIYWVIALVALAMTLIILFVKFPEVKLKSDEKVDGISTTLKLLKNKTVLLYFLGIFAYVGTEQGLANWMSEYLKNYHDLNPLVEGKNAVSLFWGMLTIGCILGLVLLKFIDSRLVLKLFSVGAMISLAFALFGSANVSLVAFSFSGFCLSVMWSVIFSLSLNSLQKNHGTFAGILCTGIAGGAIIPIIVGTLGDAFGLKAGMLFLFVTLAYILSIGFWSNPLIHNQTISLRKKQTSKLSSL